MIASGDMHIAKFNDVELVTESLGGNREAFCRIIEKYQILICSLAYCALGDVSQSEDLAQETFLTAWRKLVELREPGQLRSWLCGILRFLISKELRRRSREPVHAAEPLESVTDRPSLEPEPRERAIANEEMRILWRSLERVPEIYREPLVLFYREHQAISAVARDLELSEAAVRQRLSRGRKLLQQEFLAFVAMRLKETAPGKPFTLGVMAALPLLATTATAATVAATVGRGGSAAPAVAGAGLWSASFAFSVAVMMTVIGVFGWYGHWVGRAMGRASQQTSRGRRRTLRLWRSLAIGFFGLALAPLMLIFAHRLPLPRDLIIWSAAAYCWLVVAALVLWEWRRRRDLHRDETEATHLTSSWAYNGWVILGMIGPLCLLVVSAANCILSRGAWTNKRISELEARRIISERRDAQVSVCQNRDGRDFLSIILPEHPRMALIKFMNPSLHEVLDRSGIAYHTWTVGRNSQGKGFAALSVISLYLISVFVVAAGVDLLLRRPGTRRYYQQEITAPRAEGGELAITAMGAGLVMIAVSGILMFLMIMNRISEDRGPAVSGAEASRIIGENPSATFTVAQFHGGSKVLCILRPDEIYPTTGFSVDEHTLALLAEKKISYETLIQGQDFGFVGTWRTVVWSIVLVVGGSVLLRWAFRQKRALSAAAAA
jgi:RNA polymerase sigma factor (sigma-70 family)